MARSQRKLLPRSHPAIGPLSRPQGPIIRNTMPNRIPYSCGARLTVGSTGLQRLTTAPLKNPYKAAMATHAAEAVWLLIPSMPSVMILHETVQTMMMFSTPIRSAM